MYAVTATFDAIACFTNLSYTMSYWPPVFTHNLLSLSLRSALIPPTSNEASIAASPSLALTSSTSPTKALLVSLISTSASSSSNFSRCPLPKAVQLRAFTFGTSPLHGLI